jgi:hypothetical protein
MLIQILLVVQEFQVKDFLVVVLDHSLVAVV